VRYLSSVGIFALAYITVPAFYVTLTLALGTFVKSTAGIAGIGFLVMFVPQMIGALVPVVAEASPTAIGGWAMHIATGAPASMLTLAGFIASMAILLIGAKLVFDRKEV
jgi:hypothetical protein